MTKKKKAFIGRSLSLDVGLFGAVLNDKERLAGDFQKRRVITKSSSSGWF